MFTKLCALTLEIFFSRPNENRQKRVPVKLFTISWEKEQTSDSGTFASSKLSKAQFVTPPRLESGSVEEYNNVALKAHFLFESSRGQAQFLFMRPDASRQKRVPVKLFTISWEKEQTSDSGTFASSKLPKAPFVTPPHLPSEAEILRKRINL